jgi:putative two-component system response regulator
VQATQQPSLNLYTLTRLTEGRDPETTGHVERVCAYSAILAQKLMTCRRFCPAVDVAFVRRIGLAAALHDIGKADVPQAILLKAGPLTARESKVMQLHTVRGAESIAEQLADHPDAGLREMAVDIALTHHERWDGRGYPYGRKATDIPAAGRIVALADVYDALTSKRVYKAAFPHELARSVLLGDRGTHFDPAVVDAFTACEDALLNAAGEHAAQRARAA